MSEVIVGTRAAGTITYFNPERAYGFIECPGKRLDLFFHISDVKPEQRPLISKFAEVSFMIGDKPRGPVALDIQILKAENEG